MIDILKKVVRLTRNGSLAWEATADPDVLIAPLGGDYSVKLNLVPDFSYDPEYGDPDDVPQPDHIVTVAKGRRELFSLDRRDFSDASAFSAAFGDLLDPGGTPYTMFKEIWDRAYYKAAKIDEEVQTINRLLDAKMQP
jgi:hypothetical protein